MKGSITIDWQYARYLSKNILYINGDKAKGYNPLAKAEMYGIAFLIRPPFYGYQWNDNRIKVTVKVYRPRTNIDAHNWVDGVADAIELGIGINDSNFNVVPETIDGSDNPRIVIEVEQDEGDVILQ